MRKLLVLGGPGLPAEAIAPALGPNVQVVRAGPDTAAEALRDPAVAAVLSDFSSFLALERGVVDSDFGRLLNSLGEGVCLCRATGEIIWANDRFRRHDDRTREKVIAACKDAARRLGNAPTPASSIHCDISSDDGQRNYELVISPVTSTPSARLDHEPAPDPGVNTIAAVIWDVTTARRAEQKLAAIDRAGRELMRFEADSVRKMNAAERLTLLQDKVAQYARELLHFDHFNIRLLDKESGRLDVVMAAGLPQEALEKELYARREGNGISGYVAATGRSYLCQDAGLDARYVRGIDQAGSSLTVPIELHDQVVGVFNVESAQRAAFTDEDRRYSEIFARSIAMALHILDLLVVERSTTNEAVSGRVEGEVREPLDDLLGEAEWLREEAASDPERARHVDRILKDVESIRSRIREVARGPRTVLGADRALRDQAVDPLFTHRRILIADDETNIRDTLREVLTRRGCEVVVCDNGAAAIEALEAAKAALLAGVPDARSFDLVLSDIKMPDRNGYEVFAAAKRLNQAVPVILMTGFGYDPHHSIVRASQEGLQCVLFKPFQVERLLDEVRKALQSAPIGVK